MAARPESLAREFWQFIPDLRPVERAGERDASLEALLVGRGTRGVIAAQAHAPDGNASRVQIRASLDPIHHRACRAFVVAADRDLVLGLALPPAVDREGG